MRFADGADRNMLSLLDVWKYEWLLVKPRQPPQKQEIDKATFVAILTAHLNNLKRSVPDMQKIMLIGYLGRDPEVKYSQQGTAIAQFSVATSERWTSKDGCRNTQNGSP